MDKKRKPFTVIAVTTDARILKIENVKECVSQKMTAHGEIDLLTALYVTTEDDTFIFPFNNLIYAKLMKGDNDEC